MNFRSTASLAFALATGLMSSCASMKMESIPLLVGRDLPLMEESADGNFEATAIAAIENAEPARAVFATSSPVPAPLESSKWSRSKEPDLEPAATLGGYIGASVNAFDVEGVMDGSETFVGEGQTTLLPDIDLDAGFSLALGYRGYKYALELSWEYIPHDGTYTAGDGDTDFSVLSADIKRFYMPEARLQPYYSVGVGYVVTNLEGASFETANASNTGDARLTGLSLNLGAGFNYLITRRLSFDARGVYRYTEYQDNSGAVGNAYTLSGDADGSSFGVIVGLQYILKRDL